MALAQVKARLGAARLCLEECIGPTRDKMSSVQAAAIAATVKKVALSAEDAAAAAELVLKVKLSKNDESDILDLLLPSKSVRRRRCLQDFMSFTAYATEDQWAELDSMSSTSQLVTLATLLINLSCRCPTEGTLKLLCSVWLCFSEPSKVLAKSRPDLQASLTFAKKEWERIVANYPPCEEHIATLPSSPLQLQASHPKLFNSVFKGAVPAHKCPIDQDLLLKVECAYTCRAGAKIRTASSVTTQVALSGVHQDGLGQMALFFAKQLEQLHSNQSRMFDALMTVAHPKGELEQPAAKRPRGMLSLESLVREDAGQVQLQLTESPASRRAQL
jgi:hypothetical protein